ncbi:tetratricopeptide repeat protein [Dolichospermum sp. ST_sed10]|nr:tetratricopeptide repeat protein [Dolichospermum sp. ST_sed10]
MRLSKILIVFTFTTVCLVTKGQETIQLKVDSLLKQAHRYVSEDPNNAQIIAKKAISTSKTLKNQISQIESYLTYAESCINFSSFDEANIFIDSAITLAKNKILYKQQIHCLILSGKVNSEIGNKSLFLAKISEAGSLARRTKLIDVEVSIELLIGDFYKSSGDFDRSISSKKRALEIATKSNNKPLIADSWNSIGSTYWYFSHFQDALENYYKSFIIRENIKDTLGIIASLKNLGLVYRDLSNFDKALSQLNQALKLTDEIKNKVETSEILNLLGSLHYRFNRYNEAILYYKQSLEIRYKNGFLNSTANTLENLARVYSQKSQYDDAYQALNEALKIREQLLDQTAIASTLNEMGNLYNQKGNIAEALRRYLMSLKIRQKNRNDQDIAKSLTNIGNTYRKLGLIKNATVYLEQARDLIITGKDPSEAAYVLVNLGNLYIDQKRYDIALKVYQEALSMRKKTGDEASIARTIRNIAQVQMQIGQTDRSRDNFLVALKFSKKLNDGKAIADTYNDLGNLERQTGNFQIAAKHFEDAIKIYDESANYDGKALCLRKIGEIQIKQGKPDIAKTNIEQSITIGKEIGSMVLVHYGYSAMHDLYKSTNSHKLALDYYTKHIRIRDSLDNSRRNEKNLEAQLDLELDKKKEEIKSIEGEVQLLRQESLIKELEIEKQRELKYFAIALASLILSLAGLIFWGYYQKKKHNKVLEEKIAIIREINDKLYLSEESLKLNVQTKVKLFSIIAHDLRSPFNALVGLTEILNNKAESLSPSKIKELSIHINKSSNNVLTLIDNLLSWSRSQRGRIELKPESINLKSIVESCFEVASISAKEKNISLKSKLNKNDIAYADKDTISTVIRNLISNAIKFTSNDGEINIWAYNRNDTIDIYISDTGVGICEKDLKHLFKIDKNISTKGTNQESGTGLGLIICKEFIEKNNGSISCESELNVGTTFIITLPNQNTKS